MGTELQKQFLDLRGRPILAVTLGVFQRCDQIEGVVLVVPEDRIGFCRREIVERYGFSKVASVVAGGPERQDSVYNGLMMVPESVELVAIHDGVRPLVSPEIIRRTVEAATVSGAALPVLPVHETVKMTEDGVTVSRTLDRRRVFLAQTPQTFRRELIIQAHEWARKKGILGTDDAMLVEQTGKKVHMVPGSGENIKITTPADLAVAQLSARGGS